jgi:peptide-methionine (S)-S-oxide reductase
MRFAACVASKSRLEACRGEGCAMGLKIDPFSFPDAVLDPPQHGLHAIVLGGGCFWCTEAVYRQLEGVNSVLPGYAGDSQETADYETVSNGDTDHAEVIRIEYDADKLSLGKILKLFFSIAHDPTQVDRQGNDVGRQYRSVIFYADELQRSVAEAYIAQLNAEGVYDQSIVTELAPLRAFYEAESYHHDYAARNPYQPYIRAVSDPKVKKLKSAYSDLLKQGLAL